MAAFFIWPRIYQISFLKDEWICVAIAEAIRVAKYDFNVVVRGFQQETDQKRVSIA